MSAATSVSAPRCGQCGHAWVTHPNSRTCVPGCSCQGYRLTGARRRVGPPALRDLLNAARASNNARAGRLASRIVSDISELRRVLAGHHSAPPKRVHRRTGTCPDCGKTALANVGAHRYHAHGVRAVAKGGA